MYILVTPQAVTLEDPDNFQQFHVSVQGDVNDVGAALASAGFGSLVDEDARISVAAVRAAAAGRVDDGWDDGFAKMLEYARTKGWLEDGDTSIRAHIEAACGGP